MNKVIVLRSIQFIILALVIFSIEQALAFYVHPMFSMADVLTLYLLLVLFCVNVEVGKWLFVVGYIIGIIEAAWLGQRLGVGATYYMCMTFPIFMYKNMLNGFLQFFIMLLVAMLAKAIIYGLLSWIFFDMTLLSFLFSREFLYHLGITLLIALLFAIPIHILLRRYA